MSGDDPSSFGKVAPIWKRIGDAFVWFLPLLFFGLALFLVVNHYLDDAFKVENNVLTWNAAKWVVVATSIAGLLVFFANCRADNKYIFAFFKLVSLPAAIIFILIVAIKYVLIISTEVGILDYFLLIIPTLLVYLWFYVAHEDRVGNARLIDRSNVREIVKDAKRLVNRAKHKDSSMHKSLDKNMLKKIDQEIQEIEKERFVCKEYDILTLDKYRIELFDRHELVARARSLLEELHDYARDEDHPYPEEDYKKHASRFESLFKKLENSFGKFGQDTEAKLKANLLEFHGYIADLDHDWATGKTIILSLVICSAFSLVMFIMLGFLPFLINGSGLSIVNFSFLGASGALIAVLNFLRKADQLDAGLDKGRRETVRALIGVALGLSAGVLAFAISASGLLGGRLIPDFTQEFVLEKEEIFKGAIFAFVAGFAFDRFYERIRGMN